LDRSKSKTSGRFGLRLGFANLLDDVVRDVPDRIDAIDHRRGYLLISVAQAGRSEPACGHWIPDFACRFLRIAQRLAARACKMMGAPTPELAPQVIGLTQSTGCTGRACHHVRRRTNSIKIDGR
jgi:hypothetical protein